MALARDLHCHRVAGCYAGGSVVSMAAVPVLRRPIRSLPIHHRFLRPWPREDRCQVWPSAEGQGRDTLGPADAYGLPHEAWGCLGRLPRVHVDSSTLDLPLQPAATGCPGVTNR